MQKCDNYGNWFEFDWGIRLSSNLQMTCIHKNILIYSMKNKIRIEKWSKEDSPKARASLKSVMSKAFRTEVF